ncbi:hypothetical protein GQ457_07G007380 [Hibiscus cannabinus]
MFWFDWEVFRKVYFLLLQGGTETFREGFETFSRKVPKPCPKVSIPLMKILILPERVVYRSWTFGFDSGIPRVTISGRFYDWTGSRGLHLLVSEPGYAIIGTVSEPSPPPVGGEANEDEVTWEILLVGLSQEVIGYEM